MGFDSSMRLNNIGNSKETILIMKIKLGTTDRGFPIGEFKDQYGISCSIQKSSLATKDCIWLGVDDVDPQILAQLASAHGVKTNESTGWVKYPIPKEVLMTTRMHLTRKQVRKLLPLLHNFVETGELY